MKESKRVLEQHCHAQLIGQQTGSSYVSYWCKLISSVGIAVGSSVRRRDCHLLDHEGYIYPHFQKWINGATLSNLRKSK